MSRSLRALAHAFVLALLAATAVAPQQAHAYWHGGYGGGWHGGYYGGWHGGWGGWHGGWGWGGVVIPPPVFVPPPVYYAPPVYASPPYYPSPAYPAPPPVAQGGPAGACYAGPYICPLPATMAVGSPCSCPAGPAGVIPGTAH